MMRINDPVTQAQMKLHIRALDTDSTGLAIIPCGTLFIGICGDSTCAQTKFHWTALSFSLPGGGPAAAAEGGAVPTACCRFESNSATNHIKIAAYNQHTGTSSEYRGIASVAVQLVSHDERPRLRLRRTQSGQQPGRVPESGSESGGDGRPGGARPIARAAARARLGHSPALTGPKSQASCPPGRTPSAGARAGPGGRGDRSPRTSLGY